ncbi:FAD-dependent oxidoreductase [Streptomyces durmitorensis]|uniref:FAD-dependent oxidoreductase n=1 Tax=Streptomyces durmitorensis TaxID=319947 RepID=A0ABY4PZZ7_9ACTN|nr:FAD-dependent oxidoreductase [Streptomyces durmitorensis]UQT58684.1 FAD-dependent oxidoreductase [Streptomyces durmitorensis]
MTSSTPGTQSPHSRVVVIGGGLAGVRLAQRLGGSGDVTLIGEEPHAPYNRVLLADVLSGRLGPEVIGLPPVPGEFLRTRAVRVDRADRIVHCADGSVVPYGTLVLATGSNPVLPPLRGLFEPGAADLPRGVHAFRTMDDCLALSEAVVPGTRVVVIGGGLLGVSAARALAVRGAQVVLTQQGDRLMERQLDPAASALVHRHLTELGVEVHTECRVRGVRQTGGAIRSVELADGYVLGTDLTVLACGVRPRTGLAQAAGLDVRRGIVVDDELRTSDPHIRAIGDCAEHSGEARCLAAPALEQADALADALISPQDARPYSGTRALTRLTLHNGSPGSAPLDLAAFGDPEHRPDDDVVQLADATRGTYRKVVVRDDRLVGGVLLGELTAVGALARAWEADDLLPDDGSPLLHLLTQDGGL